MTSPPYWGLRDYDVDGQIGLKPSLGEHLDVMVEVFREVRRVLKPTLIATFIGVVGAGILIVGYLFNFLF